MNFFYALASAALGFVIGVAAQEVSTARCEAREAELQRTSNRSDADCSLTLTHAVDVAKIQNTALELCAERCGR